jgi:hypothetical protein
MRLDEASEQTHFFEDRATLALLPYSSGSQANRPPRACSVSSYDYCTHPAGLVQFNKPDGSITRQGRLVADTQEAHAGDAMLAIGGLIESPCALSHGGQYVDIPVFP